MIFVGLLWSFDKKRQDFQRLKETNIVFKFKSKWNEILDFEYELFI